MKRWLEAVFAALLLACWLMVARTADGALRDHDAARRAAPPTADLVAAAATAAAPRGR